MISKNELTKIDFSDMHSIYDNWPSIARNSYKKDWQKIKFEEYDHIIFAGMGGSGTVCDVFSAIFSKTRKQISVVKGYNLPQTINKKSLVIIISVSGNTSESISILKKAFKMKTGLMVFSSGGKLEEYCLRKKIEYRKIEELNSPRASLVNYIFALLNILEPILRYSNNQINNSIKKMFELSENISSKNLTNSNQALKLAKKINGIPLMYYPWGLQSVAIRFKNTLQENSKSHIMIEDIVEASHNGIVAWEKKSNVFPILLQGQKDNIKTKERWKAVKEFFEEKKIKYLEIYSIEGDIFTKIINLIYLLDYVTIYKAVLDKIDPTPVKPIKFIKSRTE